ncbi:amidohydrolase family protein, partial [Mycobacterium scrofulaceum]|uniref:amidohydrolase family protein n=1 Tax=Mycobacterium scrofulaceum TaxID=1783 RepID=UPI000A9BDB28
MSHTPTTLLVNGRVHSPTHPDATAMAVRGDVIAWLGGDDVGRNLFPDADIDDVDGGFVAPGFVDSHIHLTATGLTLSGLDLRAAGSREECLRLVADYAAAHPGLPVWGHGWDESSWPKDSPPSTADLDAVLGDRPAYLSRVDVHSALASTALRRRIADLPAAAGFHPDRPLTADAHHLVRAAARDMLIPEQLTEARTAALRAAAAAGIVAVHECAVDEQIAGQPAGSGLLDERSRPCRGAHGLTPVAGHLDALIERPQPQPVVEAADLGSGALVHRDDACRRGGPQGGGAGFGQL